MREFMIRSRRKVLIGAVLVVAILFAVTGTVVAGGSSEDKGTGNTVVIQEAAPAQPRAEATSAAGLSVAEQLQNAFNSAANAALPVVVEVNVTEVVRQNAVNSVSPFEFFFGQNPGGQGQGQDLTRQGLGSGVIVARDGPTVYVLTNNHVAGSASDIQVRLNNKQEYKAKLVGSDERMDLALVSFTANAGENIPVAVLGKSSDLRVGDWVIAVGNPYGFESTVTAGIVSAVHRNADEAGNGAASSAGIAQLTDYIQTDASINSGNSGGALLNLRGEVVGINTWIASQTGGSIGIGFAIPIDNAKSAIKEFIEKGKITYGWLGVNIMDVGAQTMPGVAQDLKVEGKQGSLVINVVKGSPADKGGLLPGDYVVKAGDTVTTSTQQLTTQVAWLKPGTDLPVTVIRQGVEQKLTIRIAERPDAKAQAEQQASTWPGIIPIKLTDDVRTQVRAPQTVNGLLLASVDQQSAAANAGLRGGDILTEMNGAKIDNVADFYAKLNAAKGKDIAFKVYRQGREATISFKE